MADDELMAIQSELDLAIDRLMKYMADNSEEAIDKEDAARVIFNYATPDGVFDVKKVSLGKAIQHAVDAKRRYRGFDEAADRGYQSEKARIVTALTALSEWSNFGGQPLQQRHMAALWLSAFRYGEWMTQFFGQDAGLELRAKRDIDPRKDTRLFAAWHALRLNRQDKSQYPMTAPTFETVGKIYGLSGSRVRDYIYSKKGKAALERLLEDEENDDNLL